MAQRRITRRHHGVEYHRWLLAIIFGVAALSLMSSALASLMRALAGALTETPGVAAPLWSVAALVALGAALVLYSRRHHTQGQRRRIGWRLHPRLGLSDPARTLDVLRTMTPTEFELEVGAYLRRRGYRDVRHTGCAGDLAADLVCVDAYGARVVVQCKRYGAGSSVTSPEMQLFIGMIYTHHRADYGIFVTTSTFTRPARALAEQHNIRLLDGATLAARLHRAA